MLNQVQIFDGINVLVFDTSQTASEFQASLDGESSKHNATNDGHDSNEEKWFDIPILWPPDFKMNQSTDGHCYDKTYGT